MSISATDQAFNDGVQAAIDYFERLAGGIEQIPDAAGPMHRTTLLMTINRYRIDLRKLMKEPQA